MELKIKLVKPECKKCGSKNILYRQKDKKYWCRVCGNEWKKKEEIKTRLT